MKYLRISEGSLQHWDANRGGSVSGSKAAIDAHIAGLRPGLTLNVGESIEITEPLPWPGAAMPPVPATPNYAGAAGAPAGNVEEPLGVPVMNFGPPPPVEVTDVPRGGQYDGHAEQPLGVPVMNFCPPRSGHQAAGGGHHAPAGTGTAAHQYNTPGGHSGGETPLGVPTWHY